MSSSTFARGQNLHVPDHPIGCTWGIGTSRFFLGPRNFRLLQIFKPPFKWLGSYKFLQSLLSRNSCLVLDSGNTPKWVPPSSLQMGWSTMSARKGSYPTSRPFHTYLRLTSSRPRKNLKFSRSSFRMDFTSVCPFTPVETMRNTLHTSLQSSKSLIKRGCPRSVGYFPRLL